MAAMAIMLGGATTIRAAAMAPSCRAASNKRQPSLMISSARQSLAGTRLPVLFSSSSNQQQHTSTSSTAIQPIAQSAKAWSQKVTAHELDSILSEERTSPMIIDFYATWCGPCVVLAQELEQLAVEYHGKIRFLKVDTDEEHELASQMEIRGLPTMVFVSKDVDKLAIRTEGLLPLDTIRDIIEKEILV